MNRFADLTTTKTGTQNRFSDLGTTPKAPKQNFQTTETPPAGLGGGYGVSTLKDPYSGKPLLTYESEAQKSSLLLSGRTAPSLGLTLPEDVGTGVKPSFEAGAGGDFLKAYPSTITGLADLQIDPLNLKADPHKAIIDAWDNLKGSFTQEIQNIKDLFSSKSRSEAYGAELKVAAGAVGVLFSPVTAFFAGADQIPVLGSVSKLISLPFDLMGDAGHDTAKVVVDKLPISQQAKNNIVDGVGEIFALAGQLAVGKLGADVMPRLTEKYGEKDAQTIVSKAQEIAKQKAAPEKPVVSPDGKFQTTTERPDIQPTIPKELNHPELGKIEIYKGEAPTEKNKGYGMDKIQTAHPEVIPYLDEAMKNAKIVQRLPKRDILEGQVNGRTIRMVVDHQLGTDKGIVPKTFLNDAYFVPREGVEPSTPSFSGKRSTAELPRPTDKVAQPEVKVKSEAKPIMPPKVSKLEAEITMKRPTELKAEIIPGLSKFVQKDILENVKGLVKAVPQFYGKIKESFGRMFAPETLGEQAKIADPMIAKSIKTLQQFKDSLWKQNEDLRSFWDKMGDNERFDFIDAMEKGKRYDEKTELGKGLNDQMDYMRRLLDEQYKRETTRGIPIKYIKNYFPHIWEKPTEVAKFFKELEGKLGSDKFKKMRMFDLVAEGRQAGFKLKTTNPIEVVLTRLFDGERVGLRIDLMDELRQMGLAAYDTGFKTSGNTIEVEGIKYVVAPDVRQLMENSLLAKSLWSSENLGGSAFRGFMYIKNLLVPLKLAMSLFHPIHIFFIDTASLRAPIWKRLLVDKNLNWDKGIKDLAKSSLGSTFKPKDLRFGKDVINAWYGKDAPEYAKQAVQYIIEGGGSPIMSEVWRTNARKTFMKAFNEGNYPGAVIRGIPAIIDSMQSPIFEHYIPWLKVASYIKEVKNLLETKPELNNDSLARSAELRKIWKSTDNRYGELQYDTLFWNRYLKEVGVASSLSLGWNLGFLREFGGGAIDIAAAIKNLVKGKGSIQDITPRTIFALDYSLQAAMVGGLITYALTGNRPQNLQDLFFPRTGDKNPDGSDARLTTSFYTREFFAFAEHARKEGVIGGTFEMAKNKANPVLSDLVRIWENKDFYSTEIRDPNASYMTQLSQIVNYIATNTIQPISFTSAKKAKQTMGTKGIALSILGFTPAPSYITQTDTEKKIFDAVSKVAPSGVKTLEQSAASQAKAEIRNLVQQGKMDEANQKTQEAIDKGYLTKRGKKRFMKEAKLPSSIRAFQMLSKPEQQRIYGEMPEDEKSQYKKYLKK